MKFKLFNYLFFLSFKNTWPQKACSLTLGQLRMEGFAVNDEDVIRLSPFGHGHLNMLGRYSFAMPEEVKRGELRPLRKLNDP